MSKRSREKLAGRGSEGRDSPRRAEASKGDRGEAIDLVSCENVVGIAVTEVGSTALDSMRGELAALGPDELVPLNVDVVKACAIVLAVCPGLDKYVPALTRLEGLNLEWVRSLRRYAFGALHAYILASPDDAVPALVAEATNLKQRLLLAGDALADRGLLDARRLADVRSGLGYVELARGCVSLSGMFQEAWGAVANKTAVSREEIDRVGVVGANLLQAVGRRAVGADNASIVMRQRAFSLLVRAYEEVRHGLQFLRRREGDMESIAPSLYLRKRRRSSSRDAAENPSSPAPSNEAPAALGPVHADRASAPAAPSLGPSDTRPAAAPHEPGVPNEQRDAAVRDAPPPMVRSP